MPVTKRKITFSLSQEMADRIEELIKEEDKTINEFLSEALKRYVEDQELKKIFQYGEMKAQEKGITEDQVEAIIDARRK